MNENLRILKPFLRGFPLIVLAMILAVVAAKKYLSYVTPMYESTAKMKLADVNEGVPSSNLFKDFDVFATSNKIAAEIEVLKSSALLNKTLDSLDFGQAIYRVGKLRKVELYHDSPVLIDGMMNNPKAFDKVFRLQVTSKEGFTVILPDNLGAVTGKFGDTISFSYGRLYISLNRECLAGKPDVAIVDQYEFEFLSRPKLISQILKDLDIVAVDKDVAVIRISFKHSVPKKAAALVNRLTETYIDDYIETKYKAAGSTVRFLKTQIDDIASKLTESENMIEGYRNINRITNITQETETDLRKISQLKIQQTNISMSLMAIDDLNRYIQSGKENFLDLAPNFEAFTDLLSTEIVKNIKNLQAEKKDLLLIYTPEEDRVKVIDRKIDDLKNYLIESIANTKRNLEIKNDKLNQDIAEAEKVFVGVPEKEKILTIMNREFAIYQQSYNFLNEKKIEAEIAQAAKIAFHRVLVPALPSKTPVSPNRSIIIIVSAILGLFGAMVLIYLVHLAKAKVNDTYTIEKNSALPIALLTPNLENAQKTGQHFMKEALQLEIKGILNEKCLLVFSSNKNHEGRSFHAFCLSVVLARQGRRVILMDADNRLSYLINHNGKGNGTIDTSFENLSYLSLQDPKYSGMTKKALQDFLGEYKKSFDVIIINNEALENETKGLLLMSVADTNLFVLDSRRTPARLITKTDIMKEEFRLPDTWFVLNRHGYNPNIVRQIWCWIRNVIIKSKKPQTIIL